MLPLELRREVPHPGGAAALAPGHAPVDDEPERTASSEATSMIVASALSAGVGVARALL